MLQSSKCPRLLKLIFLVGSMGCLSANTQSIRNPYELQVGTAPPEIVLDGRDDDWPQESAGFMLGEAAQLLGRSGQWAGAEDLSGSFRFLWSKQGLYLLATVIDQKPKQAESDGAGPWHGDSMELFVNIDPGEQQPRCFRQIALVPTIDSNQPLVVVSPQATIEGVVAGTQLHAFGYTFEALIPWSNFAPFEPREGQRIGFQLILNDSDGPGRKSQLCWYPSAVTYTRPQQMGLLELSQFAGSKLEPSILSALETPVTRTNSFVVSALIQSAQVSRVRVFDRSEAVAANAKIPLLEIDMNAPVAGLAAGSGRLPITHGEGLVAYRVEYLSASEQVLHSEIVEFELIGERYQQLKSDMKVCRGELDTLALEMTQDTEYAEWVTGVSFWLKRLEALIQNEARPGTAEVAVVDNMIAEMSAIQEAMHKLEIKVNPYVGLSGSFIRAYRSPLTGELRAHAMIVSEQAAARKKRPLIVVLHGIYGDERHLFLQQDLFGDMDAIIYQAASYRQFDWSDLSATETWTGLDQVLQNYSVDRDRIFLVGHHIGGRGALQFAMERPGFFAAIAACYPGVDAKPAYPALKLYPETYQEAVDCGIPYPHFKQPDFPQPIMDPVERGLYEMQSLATRAAHLKELPIWMVRGEANPDAAAERIALVRALDPDFIQTSKDIGAMHGDTPPLLSDSALYDALLLKRRSETPEQFTAVVTELRHNRVHYVQIDSMNTPLQPARIEVNRSGQRFNFKTENVSVFTPIADATFLESADAVTLVVDGQTFKPLRDQLPRFRLVRGENGQWKTGDIETGVKRHGLSGPIHDVQREHFVFVYGNEAEVDWARAVSQLANYGLGAVFESKSADALTTDDISSKHLVLVGSPETNAIIARIADELPLKWAGAQLVLGDWSAPRNDAVACFIYPNPISAEKYVVVIATDRPEGTRIWKHRSGVDFVAGQLDDHGRAVESLYRGVFDSDWQFDPALTTELPAGVLK